MFRLMRSGRPNNRRAPKKCDLFEREDQLSDGTKRWGGHVQLPTILVLSLSPAEEKVYSVIRSHWNSVNHKCYPRTDTIASKAKMSERNVSTIRNNLKQPGILKWSGGRGRGNVCNYEFPLQEGTIEEKIEIVEGLKRRSRVPLLGNPKKEEISDTKRGSMVPRMMTPENHPKTPVGQGFESSQKGEDTAPLTKNYIKKELKPGASLDNGQGYPPLEGRQPGLKASLQKKAAERLLMGFNGREPEPSEVDRVQRLLQRGLGSRQIMNILKTTPRAADGTFGR